MTATQTATASVADVVGATIAAQGAQDAFGVIGSGNLIVTNALARHGTRFHHARHEEGAVCMADGYARVSGRVGVCSVHQGPGLTNTLTGLTEAAKSRTPLLVLAGETPAAALTSNFRIDQHDLVESVGAIADRVFSAATAADDAQRAYQRAQTERRPVVLMLPIDIQPQRTDRTEPTRPPRHPLPPPEPNAAAVARAADLIEKASRPAIIAGRGAVLAAGGDVGRRDAGGRDAVLAGGNGAGAGLTGARDAIEALGATTGAILATSAPANGLFAGLPYDVGISGGFASPFAAELLAQADVHIVFGASFNQWTTRHGALINPAAKVIQVDVETGAIGRHWPVDVGILGDATATARALTEELERRGDGGTGARAGRDEGAAGPRAGPGDGGIGATEDRGFRRDGLERELADRRWRNEPYEDASSDEFIDPRTLSIALNELIPPDRVVSVDSGHFLGYPSMYLDVLDPRAWVFPNGFQAVGLGLGNAIGAAIARPDVVTVAAIGDGGAFMALPELETAARLKLTLLVLIYDDAAYGAEVHHFAPMGHDISLVRFPDADLAAIARAVGAKAATVRGTDELAVVEEWLVNAHGPLVLDAKVNPTICAEWLEEAFRAG